MSSQVRLAQPGVAPSLIDVVPGESWRSAAQRAGPGPVFPLDLAAEPPLFTTAVDWQVTLRAATPGDLPDLVRWRQHAHIRRWWAADGEPTADRVRAQYAPEIAGESPTRLWIVEAHGRSVGFLQDYLLRDHPDFAVLTPDPDAVGVDYAIGEPSWVGRGLGPQLLWSWLLAAHARHPDVETAFAAPDHRNSASLRALAKVGFREGTWFDEPQSDGTVATVVGCTLRFAQVLA